MNAGELRGILYVIETKVPALRSAGVLELEVGEVRVVLAPELPELGSEEERKVVASGLKRIVDRVTANAYGAGKRDDDE